MAFEYPSKNAFLNRYKNLHETLREVVDSSETNRVFKSICREHYLNSEKEELLGALVSFVLMGFLPQEDLANEIGEQLFLNDRHSKELANEINTRVFYTIKDEIASEYNPTRDEGEQPSEIGVQQYEAIEPEPLAVESETEEIELPNTFGENIRASAGDTSDMPVSLQINEDGGPAVLQEGASFFKKSTEQAERRAPIAPFKMFASSSESTDARPTVRVKVETPRSFGWPAEKKEEESVVHYNESAFPTDQQSSEGLIHLEAIQNITPDTTKSSPIPAVETPVVSQDVVNTELPAVVSQNTEDKKAWSIKSIFKKENTNEKKISFNEMPATDTDQHIPVQITTSVSKDAPFVISTEESSKEVDKKDPALDGNVVHLK